MCSLMLLWPFPAMTQPIKESLSLESGDGIKEVSFKRHAQNLCQIPNHTRFAGRLVFVDQRSPGFKSFTLFVGQVNFSALLLLKRINAW